MKIAIQVADLDSKRIDGTRVYILNLLKNFGKIDFSSQFLLYHKKDFNPELTPPEFSNYKIIRKNFSYLWTQTRFAFEIWKDNPDVLWMPMQALPVIRRKNLKTIITVHDLAFKIFPGYFPKSDLRRLNLYGNFAIKNANKIIAVSESTKNDILKFFPEVNKDKIKVIYHGFDKELFQKERNLEKEKEIKNKLGISGDYILYTGALQPRKNLGVLIEAFDLMKKNNSQAQLVLVGGKAWMWEKILEAVEKSPNKKDIILTGKVSFSDLGHILQGASAYVFPSLYEGFGIPVLEAMAAGVPVICANNSSLTEVGGDAALYFESRDANGLSDKITKVLEGNELRKSLIQKGKEQIKKFSWEKCAKETLEYLKEGKSTNK